MLVVLQKSGRKRVFKQIGDGLTLGKLAEVDGRLYGTTTNQCGMGLSQDYAAKEPIKLVELDKATGEVLSSSVLEPVTFGDVKGFIPLENRGFLIGAGRHLWTVDLRDRLINPRPLPMPSALQKRITAMAQYNSDNVFILTDEALLSYNPKGGVRALFKLKLSTPITFMAVAGRGDLFLAGPSRIYLIPAQLLSRTIW